MAGIKKGFLTIPEAAAMIGVTNETLRRHVRNGDIPYEMKNKRDGIKIYTSDFINFVSNNPRYRGKFDPEKAAFKKREESTEEKVDLTIDNEIEIDAVGYLMRLYQYLEDRYFALMSDELNSARNKFVLSDTGYRDVIEGLTKNKSNREDSFMIALSKLAPPNCSICKKGKIWSMEAFAHEKQESTPTRVMGTPIQDYKIIPNESDKSIKLGNIGLSTRVYRGLYRMGIQTVNDLEAFKTLKDVMNYGRHLGPRSMDELFNHLIELGFELDNDARTIVHKEAASDQR